MKTRRIAIIGIALAIAVRPALVIIPRSRRQCIHFG